MRVTVLPIIVGAFETVQKGLEERREEIEIRGKIERIQTKALLRSVQKTLGDLLSFRLQWETNSESCWE